MSILFQNPAWSNLAQALLVVDAFICLLLCLDGHEMWRFFLGLVGLGLGAWGGVLAGAEINTYSPIWVTAIVGALIGCALFAGVVPLGTFLVSGCWVFVIALALTQTSRIDTETRLAICTISGALIGIAIIAMGKSGIIVLTSLGGGLGLLIDLYNLLQLNDISLGVFASLSPTEQTVVVLGAGFILGLIGMAIQFSTLRTANHKSKHLATPNDHECVGCEAQPASSSIRNVSPSKTPT